MLNSRSFIVSNKILLILFTIAVFILLVFNPYNLAIETENHTIVDGQSIALKFTSMENGDEIYNLVLDNGSSVEVNKYVYAKADMRTPLRVVESKSVHTQFIKTTISILILYSIFVGVLLVENRSNIIIRKLRDKI